MDGRQPQTKMEEDLEKKGRQPQNKMEDNPSPP
jgi:hypothetical protein